jgi:Domain of unknown function (DUF4153)
MTDLAAQKNEKRFILGVALVQGITLLLIWLWVDSLTNARQYFDVILPLYVLAISLPLSLMLLAHQPRKLTFCLASIFSLIVAFCAMYFGDISYVKDLPRYDSTGLVFQFSLCVIVAWFIAVTFIEHYCQYQHWFNQYQSLYDFSWRNAVKLITASMFTGLFWAALLLLAGLFNVLGIHFFQDLIKDVYFIYPSTAVAFGLGISLYNAKQEALSEFKRAILQVLGWLLPLVSLILVGFIFTLPFKGLSALWATGYATSLMLGLLALMVLLLNTAFQDGKQIQYPSWLLKLTSFGVLTMPIYALLCIYALHLRVVQYGWTDDRVWAASITFIAALYSVGYAYAAFKSLKPNTAWMQIIKPVNILTAACLLLLIALIYSPIFSPMRIGVQSQLARLNNGKVPASVFDYAYLRFSGGKYGDAALRTLLADTANPQAETIKPLVEAALKSEYPSYAGIANERKGIANVADLKALITVYPKGAQVDADFYKSLYLEVTSGQMYFSCLDNNIARQGGQKPQCYVLSIDLNKDKQAELVVLNQGNAQVYSKDGTGWKSVGTFYTIACCENRSESAQSAMKAALEAGDAQAVAPSWQDLKIGDKTYLMQEAQAFK